MKHKKVLTAIEVVVVLLVIIVAAVLLLPLLDRSREAWRRGQCQNILRQWGQAMALYASEAPGNRYPPMHVVDKRHGAYPVGEDCLQMLFAPQFDAVFPAYQADPTLARCPSNPGASELRPEYKEASTAPDVDKGYYCYMSYCYAGWAFDRLDTEPNQQASAFPHIIKASSTSEDPIFEGTYLSAQFATGMDAYLAAVDAAKEKELPGLRFLEIADGPLPAGALGNNGGDTLHRLATGVERFLISDVNNDAAAAEARGKIWVMMDSFAVGVIAAYFNHMPGGSNVLFLDGTVRFIKYAGGMEGPHVEPSGEAPVLHGVGSVFGELF